MASVVVVEACLLTFLQAHQSCHQILSVVEQVAEVVVSPVVVVSFAPLELFVVVAEEVFVVLWLLWEQVQEMLVVALVLVEV